MDKKFVLTALLYAMLGLGLGIYMGISGNHGQLVTHAHIMLVGFVVSFIYGLCHKLWLRPASTWLANIQFYLHQFGAIILLASLFLMFGGFAPASRMEPILGFASILVFLGMCCMFVLFVKSKETA